jgi:hypothetical protein
MSRAAIADIFTYKLHQCTQAFTDITQGLQAYYTTELIVAVKSYKA